MESAAAAKKQQSRKRQRTRASQVVSSADGTPALTAEQRKRRARHIIWELEDEIEQHVKAIEELERHNKMLLRRQELMAKTVAVRERQVQMLKQFGVGEDASASSSHLLLQLGSPSSSSPSQTPGGPAPPPQQQRVTASHHAQTPRQPSFTHSLPSATMPAARAASSCAADSATDSASLSAPRNHNHNHNRDHGVDVMGDIADMLEMEVAEGGPSRSSDHHHHVQLLSHRREEDHSRTAAVFAPHATAGAGAVGCGMECGAETGSKQWPACVGGEAAVRAGGVFPWLTPCHTAAPASASASADNSGTSSATHRTSHLSSHNGHSNSGRRGVMGPPPCAVNNVGSCAAGHLCSIFLSKVLAGVSSQLGCGQHPPAPAARFPSDRSDDVNALVLHQRHGSREGCMPQGTGTLDGTLDDLQDEFQDELCHEAGLGMGAGMVAGVAAARGGSVSPAALASCRALGQLVARCRPPGTSPASDGDVMPLVVPGSVAGGGGGVCGVPAAAVQLDLGRLVLLGEAQVLDLHKRASQELSQLLFAAEDAMCPGYLEAQQHVEAAVHTIRTLGSLLKVCNPCMVRVASRPLSGGLDLAGYAHWDSVARALLLSPQQAQDVATLNGMRLQWLARAQKEHVVVSQLLADVMRGIQAAKWKVSHAKVELSEAELLAKLQRVAGAGRWVQVLVDDVLTSHVLSSIQVARWMVHSYPYVPDACALVEAICRVHPAADASTAQAPSAQQPMPVPAQAQATPRACAGQLPGGASSGATGRRHGSVDGHNVTQGGSVGGMGSHAARVHSCV